MSFLLNYKTFKAQIFNRGQSSKVFKEVCETHTVAYVIRNSAPYVAIIDYEEYLKMSDKADKYDRLSKEQNK